MAQPPITKAERHARDGRELAAWEPMRAAGEAVQRERRAATAAKAREDGVDMAQDDRTRAIRAKL